MSGINSCHFIGNAGRDPEMRSINSGKQVCNFSIGVTERKDGETLWVNIVCFDKLADVVAKYVTKGKQVYVQGRLQVRKYVNKDGEEKQSVELVASTVQFLGGGGKGAGAGTDEAVDRVATAFKGTTTKTTEGDPPDDDGNDRIPF